MLTYIDDADLEDDSSDIEIQEYEWILLEQENAEDPEFDDVDPRWYQY